MYKISFETDSREEFEDYLRRLLPETEMSTTAADHGTHPDTNIIAQDEEDVKDIYSDEQIVFEELPLSLDDKINYILAKLPGGKVRLGSDPYPNRVSGRKFCEKLFYRVDGDEGEFLERFIVPYYAYRGQKNAFHTEILKEVDAFLANNKGNYDLSEFIKRISTKHGKGKHDISANEFIDMIRKSHQTYGRYGLAAQHLYNLCRRTEEVLV